MVNILTVRDRLQDIRFQPGGKGGHPLGVARGAEVSSTARNGQKVLVGTRRTAHPSEATVQISAIDVLIDDLTDDGAPEAVLPLIDIVINLFEAVKVILDQGEQWGIARISRMINACRLPVHKLQNRAASSFTKVSDS
jgi:hypothetical protein